MKLGFLFVVWVLFGLVTSMTSAEFVAQGGAYTMYVQEGSGAGNFSSASLDGTALLDTTRVEVSEGGAYTGFLGHIYENEPMIAAALGVSFVFPAAQLAALLVAGEEPVFDWFWWILVFFALFLWWKREEDKKKREQGVENSGAYGYGA